MLIAAISSAAASNQFVARYVPLGSSGVARLMTADASGNLFIVAKVVEPSGRSQIRAIKTDPEGNELTSFDFGGSSVDLPSGVAVDPQGNLVIVGSTPSGDFPLVSPLISTTTTHAAFVVKLDSQLSRILFSTRLGGTQGTSPNDRSTAGNAVVLDGTGNIYVTGSTKAADFPTTAGAFQTTGPDDGFGSQTFAFLTEISPDGSRMVYSTFFGAGAADCVGGSSCTFVVGKTNANTIAIDSTGAVFIGGDTTASHLPVTPGTLGQRCECIVTNSGTFEQSGFLAKFNAGGRTLAWATYIPPAGRDPGESILSITSIALAADASVVISGRASNGLFVTKGALQPSYPGDPYGQYNAGFIAEVNPAASSYVFSTYFGNITLQSPYGGVAIDSQGDIWLTGASDLQALPFPSSVPRLGSAFIAELSGDGSSILSAMTAPAGAAGQALQLLPNGSAVGLGVAGSVLLSLPGQPASLLGITNSAGIQVSSNIAPYELVSLYGIGIGPANPLTGSVQNGAFPTSLGGVQVLFNNVAAPLLYAGPNQINAVVPSAVAARDTAVIQIVTPAGILNGPSVFVVLSQPEVFKTGAAVPVGGAAAAINQDGTVNSVSNPAPSGSVVSIWATGAGLDNSPGNQDGLITSNLYTPLLPVSVLNGLDSLEVLYGGSAPEIVTGAVQVNFRLSSQSLLTSETQVPFQLQIGAAISSRFSIYVAP
jgi:uncharacterized protein (TIGR03437 family)